MNIRKLNRNICKIDTVRRMFMNEAKTKKQLYKDRLKRFHDAVSLKEPDRVPIITPGTSIFDTLDAGYTMAEVLYDYEKAKDAIRQFLTRYEPDSGYLCGTGLEGTGPMLEKSQCKCVRWAGMPGNIVDDNGVHQFIEFELVKDEEIKELSRNLGEFSAVKFLPRAFGLLEPMQHFDLTGTMQATLGKAGYQPLGVAFAGEVEEMGFPIMTGPPTFSAFDFYSDYLRGTLLASTDLYDYEEELSAFLSDLCDLQIEEIKKNPPQEGRIKFMPMHKGKTIVHFEEIDIVNAKKELKDVACISGVYPAQLLNYGTKQQVVDEAKRLLDICAPGGGYIFDFDGGLYESKRENVEALFDTIKTYGKY